MVRSLTWALECDRLQGRRSVLLQVLEVDLGEGRMFEAVRKSILRRGKLLRSGQQAGSSATARNSKIQLNQFLLSVVRLKTIGCFEETIDCFSAVVKNLIL